MNVNIKEYIRLCSIPAVQEKIREGMGIEENNICFCGLSKENHGFIEDHDYAGSQTPNIIIPQPIDSQNPERGLWGMVDWNKVECFTGYDGEITIAKRGSGEHISHQLPPELALLRALMWQWGIEEVKDES
jgi:hypothetical protein